MEKLIGSIEIPKLSEHRPSSALLRSLFEANAEELYTQFHNYIHMSVDFLKMQAGLERHRDMLDDFRSKFDASFDFWRDLLNWIGTIPNYDGAIMDLVHLGMWDSAYANDPDGNLSPFGPWLAELGRALDGARIGVLHGFEQQLWHQHKANLVKAQQLAIDLYDHFLGFVDANSITALKPDYEHPPVIQLYAGGAVTVLKDMPVPTIIAMDQAKAHKFSGFSALSHEFGHDVSGTFRGAALVQEITDKVADLHLPHSGFWELWIEECFADAVGVATIGEGEIFSLANLFSNFYTNIIFEDEDLGRPDEHPNRHVRVLLTIEVGRILGIDASILDQTEAEWIAFGENMNKHVAAPSDKIYDQFNNRLYPMEEFVDSIGQVAEVLVDKPCGLLGGKRVRDIFAAFESVSAEEMRIAIGEGEKKWV